MKEKKMINTEIGANIKREREKAGLTQEKLSERMGIGVKSLSAIERGAVGISLASLKNLCAVLSVSSDALIFGETEKNDTAVLSSRLERLSPEQFKLASEIMNALLSAFSLSDER